MTAAQFALAVRADSKWVQNAARILGKRFRYSVPEARWLALVRMLNREFSIPLEKAGRLATAALRYPSETREMRLLESGDGAAAIVLDIARFHSDFVASLGTALVLGTPRMRGRRARGAPGSAVERARKFGVDIDLLHASLALTPEERLARLDSDARFITALRATRPYPRTHTALRVAERAPSEAR